MPNPIQPPVVAPTPSSANTYTDVNGLAALKKDPTSPQAIHAVAQQVDALFMQMMLKSMRDASTDVGEPASNEMSMYQDMFDKQVALQLSQRGGLGIGSQLAKQLATQAAAKAQSAATKASAATPAAGAATGAGTAAAPPTSMLEDAIHFVGKMLPSIQKAAASLGVSPVGMLAQAALETGWGKRMPHTADGSPSRNVFGIKADGGWAGDRATAHTVEFSGGVATPRVAAFRAYGSVEDSVNDFANLLQSAPRYRHALGTGGDTSAYIKAMGASGYATDPAYANKLNDLVNSSVFRTALIVNAAKS